MLQSLILAGALFMVAQAQTVPVNPNSPKQTSTPDSASHDSPYRTVGSDARAAKFYRAIWGVDALSVKSVESGEMIRFSYTVLDADKAAQLNDKKSNPLLIDEKARVSLVVPTMEKVGQLRQSGPPEAGKSYWMVFSNKRNVVKTGDHVSVVIGRFRVDGLIVQ